MASAPGTLRFGEIATTPPAPPVGYALFYVKTDNVVYVQDSSGTEIPLGSPSSITQLTGDVIAAGPGVSTATVAYVGTKSAADIAQSVIDTQAATNLNTSSTIVKRDASNNFSAGTITATLTGTATNITSTSNSTLTTLPSLLLPTTQLTGTLSSSQFPALTGDVITTAGSLNTGLVATSNSTLTTLSSLSLPTTQLSGNISLTTQVSGILPIINGGTNSSTSLNNNRIMISSAGSIVEQSAITSNRALISDASGLPTSSITTATELTYVNGVTSSIQTQLNGKQATGNYITALTGDVTATGPGSVSSIVNTVGGSSAANIHTAELAANAATSSNTANTIAKRDSNGNITAGILFPTTSKSSTYSISLTDRIIFVDTSSGAFSLNLPNPAISIGKIFEIVGTTGTMNANPITLVRFGSEKIEGLTSNKLLQTNWGWFKVTTNGTDWFLG